MRHTELDNRKNGYDNAPRVRITNEDLARKVLEVRASLLAHETRRTFRERNERVNALMDSGVSFRYLAHGRYCDQAACPIVCVGTSRDTGKQCKRPIDTDRDCASGYPLYPTLRGLCTLHTLYGYNEITTGRPVMTPAMREKRDQEIKEINFVWTEYLEFSDYGDFDYSCWE
jgi:hypothetical protein